MLVPGAGKAALILETASLGETGTCCGALLFPDEYLAARFSVAQPTQVTAIGGHIAAAEEAPGPLFGAIVSLASPTAVPSFAPYDIESYAIAAATFTPPDLSEDLSIPMSVLLAPGDYAVVFGSGAFGATGQGTMIDNNPFLGSPSYFYSDGNVWQPVGPISGGEGDVRFVVYGDVVPAPEPGTLLLVGVGAIGLAWRRSPSARGRSN